MFGGLDGYGTFFKVKPNGSLFDPAGKLITLRSFDNVDGSTPGALVVGPDGNFYGTTEAGGLSNKGTIFKITPTGTITTIYSFSNAVGSFGLALGPDGNFYGTTSAGGSNDDGTIFKITPTGTFTVLHNFNGMDGSGPGKGLGAKTLGYLTLGQDGGFYGTTNAGGTYNQGTVFKLALNLTPTAPSITSRGIVPVYSTATTIQPGEWVSIYGTNLASNSVTWNSDFPISLGGTSVTINGKSAYLWFVSSTQINLQAPDDTATGTVSVVVTTAGGSSASTVTLAQFGPSFSLLNSKYAAVIVATPGSLGNSGAGYDIIGPAGAFWYPTRPAKAGEIVQLYGVGFGPTAPPVPAGQVFSGAAASATTPHVVIGGVSALVKFAGIVESGLFQFNVVVPNVGSGDNLLQATIGGLTTPNNVFLTVQ